MKTVQVEINLYSLNELNESSMELAHTTTYTGKQPKSGNSYFIHDKKEYLIQ